MTEASSRSSWTESLIAAHEIGHNFGAPHDGEANTACASTAPGRFLMSPSINGNDNFSDCSLGVMRPRAASASCVTALPAADIAVEPDFGVLQHSVGRNFEWNVTVSNVGGVGTVNARAEIIMPPVITVEEAFVLGGSCVTGAGVITCPMDPIAGGGSTVINLILRSDVVGMNDVAIRVSATNETRTSNNSGSARIKIEAEADVGIGLRAPPSVTNGTPFNVSLTASNLSGAEARGITVTVDLPEGVSASAASLDGATCTLRSAGITCLLDSLASGATVTGTASLTASTDGNSLLQARVRGNYVDPAGGNDSVTASVNVTSPATTRQTTSSGGGGGSAGWPLLWSLLALLGMKNLQRRR
ncbi:MAG TPA: M12 family metallo-peptidase [Candidatus Synoicihabitans sp.]|nr:M12 family metallo-peptidase [Candidatus Synoicihabitans sp.]